MAAGDVQASDTLTETAATMKNAVGNMCRERRNMIGRELACLLWLEESRACLE